LLQAIILDILACPIDGHFPLEPISLKTRNEDILDGVLLCETCGRWFPIRGGIPHLVRDGLRFQEQDLAFLKEYKERLPPLVVEKGLPINLWDAIIHPTPEEKQCLEEGAFWSEYVKVHYAVGDTTILDVRSRSTHPSFYNLGVLEPDDKDRVRRYGMWPDHLSRVIFGFLEKEKPGIALDVGCGGGQFGLEAAHLGWVVLAMDIALGALEVGRDYASQKGLDMHYIYAEPANPPIRKKTIDLLMAKDAFHHLLHLEEVFRRLHALVRDDGKCLFFDHVRRSPVAQWIKRQANRYLHPKIQRRYPRVEVPEVLKRGSPCEDVGTGRILTLAERYFHITRSVKEIMLYHDLEFSIYYAFGKRLWFARLMAWLVRWFVEKPLLFIEGPEYAILIGKKRQWDVEGAESFQS